MGRQNGKKKGVDRSGGTSDVKIGSGSLVEEDVPGEQVQVKKAVRKPTRKLPVWSKKSCSIAIRRGVQQEKRAKASTETARRTRNRAARREKLQQREQLECAIYGTETIALNANLYSLKPNGDAVASQAQPRGLAETSRRPTRTRNGVFIRASLPFIESEGTRAADGDIEPPGSTAVETVKEHDERTADMENQVVEELYYLVERLRCLPRHRLSPRILNALESLAAEAVAQTMVVDECDNEEGTDASDSLSSEKEVMPRLLTEGSGPDKYQSQSPGEPEWSSSAEDDYDETSHGGEDFARGTSADLGAFEANRSEGGTPLPRERPPLVGTATVLDVPSSGESAADVELSSKGVGELILPTIERAKSEVGKKKKVWEYAKHVSSADVKSMVDRGEAFIGEIRMNPRNFSEAHVTVPGGGRDKHILSRRRLRVSLTPRIVAYPAALLFAQQGTIQDRNRAFHGDTVAVVVSKPRQSREKENVETKVEKESGSDTELEADPEMLLDKAAEVMTEKRKPCSVIAIVERKAKELLLAGTLKGKSSDGQIKETDSTVVFHPTDRRYPKASVSMAHVKRSKELNSLDKERIPQMLVIVRYDSWHARAFYPSATIQTCLGSTSDINAVSRGILEGQQISDADFSPEVIACLPKLPFVISKRDIKGRRDFRNEAVFSIDPETARDLDDALSVRGSADGTFKIGIHIADVSHFISSNSPLDLAARERSTSVYFVDRVIPMLPRFASRLPLLLLNPSSFCQSLVPNEDRLAFSVVIEMDKKANIQSLWFGKSIIRSCARLSYKQAQEMIEAKTTKDAKFEVTVSSGFKGARVVHNVKQLHTLAQILRKRRMDGGAISFGSSEIRFELDASTSAPVSFEQKESYDSNHLVEEFMVLANICVAKFISDAFVDIAPLRRHPPPKEAMLASFADMVKHTFGIDLDVQNHSSKALQKAILTIQEKTSATQVGAVEMMLTKPMQEARYFCTADFEESEWSHYGLSIPRYTHFTSPIRRYVDLLVHRVLEMAILEHGSSGIVKTTKPYDSVKSSVLGLNSKSMRRVLSHCNDKNQNSKEAQRQSQALHLRVLLRNHPIVCDGAVIDIARDSITVYVPQVMATKKFAIKSLRKQVDECIVREDCRRVDLMVSGKEYSGPSLRELCVTDVSPELVKEESSTGKKGRRRKQRGNRETNTNGDASDSEEELLLLDSDGRSLLEIEEDGCERLSLSSFDEIKVWVGAAEEIHEGDLKVKLILRG